MDDSFQLLAHDFMRVRHTNLSSFMATQFRCEVLRRHYGISSNSYIFNTTNIYHPQDSHNRSYSQQHLFIVFIGLFDIFVECLNMEGTIVEGYFCTPTLSARFNKCCKDIGELDFGFVDIDKMVKD